MNDDIRETIIRLMTMIRLGIVKSNMPNYEIIDKYIKFNNLWVNIKYSLFDIVSNKLLKWYEYSGST